MVFSVVAVLVLLATTAIARVVATELWLIMFDGGLLHRRGLWWRWGPRWTTTRATTSPGGGPTSLPTEARLLLAVPAARSFALMTCPNLPLPLLGGLTALLFESLKLFFARALDAEHSEGDRRLHALHHL